MSNPILVVTNRKFRKVKGENDYELLDGINAKGSTELRLFEAIPNIQRKGGWALTAIKDKARRSDVESEGADDLWSNVKSFAGSHLATGRIVKRLRANQSNLVFFVHGYNTNVYDALHRAKTLVEAYNVEVVVFTWPSNGGGDHILEDLHGKATYKWDKKDARNSTEALDSALAKMNKLIMDLNEGVLPAIQKEALERYPENREVRREWIAKELRKRACPFNVTLIAHSMGNYLYKKMIQSSGERLSENVYFDNVILKAADTNHKNHAEWVEKIRARHRVYITINQDDAPLRLSTVKIGDEQKTRLGNTIQRQDAANATYIDFSQLLEDEHSYFVASDVSNNAAPKISDFFGKALNGEIAEEGMRYQADRNVYRF